DWFDPEYHRRPETHNPHGPEQGRRRSFRGGGWLSEPVYLQPSKRFGLEPARRFDLIGVRLAANP
ncbi:MAG: hypothetical protein H7831_15325, partial [Magnetococcus sp. WYHC-3]